MQYRQDVRQSASGVNCYLNSNHTYYLAQSLHSIVYVLENFHSTFANLVAPPIDVASFSALQSTSSPITDVENCV